VPKKDKSGNNIKHTISTQLDTGDLSFFLHSMSN